MAKKKMVILAIAMDSYSMDSYSFNLSLLINLYVINLIKDSYALEVNSYSFMDSMVKVGYPSYQYIIIIIITTALFYGCELVVSVDYSSNLDHLGNIIRINYSRYVTYLVEIKTQRQHVNASVNYIYKEHASKLILLYLAVNQD